MDGLFVQHPTTTTLHNITNTNNTHDGSTKFEPKIVERKGKKPLNKHCDDDDD